MIVEISHFHGGNFPMFFRCIPILIGLPSFPPASSAGTPSRAGLAPDLRGYDERATGSYGIVRNQHMKNGEINGKHGELE